MNETVIKQGLIISGSTAASGSLTTTGNVGIGTTSPANKLHIYGADGLSYIRWTSDVATTGARIGYNGTEFRIDQQQNADIALRTNGSERMRITSAGNVGIGTTNPTYQLHVSSSTAALGVYERAGGAALYLEGQLTKGVVGTVGTHPLVIAYNSGEVARFTGTSFDITGSLNVGGTTTVSGSIIVQDGSMGIVSTGTTNATEAFKVQNATPEDMLVVKDDGELQISTGKYSNDGVLTNNGGIVTEIVGWSGTININQPSPDPPIQIQVDKGIIVNVT